jgi:Ni/Co efflux regulator RcnB
MNRFMKAAVVGLMLVTSAAPISAQAQSRGHSREYRQDHRDGQREYRRDRNDDRRGYGADRWNGRRYYSDGPGYRGGYYGRAGFHDYRGARYGYWYAPSYGYYPVEPRYYGYHWRRGGYLPPAYRGYYVHDPYAYGLAYPPYGYRYVYADGDIVLIALATGLIASVLYDAY